MKLTEVIKIRSLHTIKELEEVRSLESKIWGELDSVPTHQTITAVKNGGLMLGAYHNEQLVGFQYSFPGFNGNSLYLCSHTLGTDESFRNKGIGEKLKLAQRQEALKLGYNLITWTYDPLESINGYLNVGKLGGVCSTYLPNCYGDMDDLLNNGIPSDRFLVEWNISEESRIDTVGKMYQQDFILDHSLLSWGMNEKGFPYILNTSVNPIHNKNIQFVPIPKDYRFIREQDMELANDWRIQTRTAFTMLFNEGWQVDGFKKMNADSPVNFYILSKKQPS